MSIDIRFVPQTNQQVFDRAIEFFKKTDKPCRDDNNLCTYFNPLGNCCVVGDMLTNPQMITENGPIDDIIEMYHIDLLEIDGDFLSHLQCIHDGYSIHSKMHLEYWSPDGGLNLFGWRDMLWLGNHWDLDASKVFEIVEVLDAVAA